MSAIRAKNTKAEIRLRKLLSARGLRFRLHRAGLPGRPDVVFVSKKIAVFCDGDYWHGRHWKRRKAKVLLGVRAKYWVNKIETNIARDRRNNRDLKRLGWTILRYWETDILKDGERIADEIERSVRRKA